MFNSEAKDAELMRKAKEELKRLQMPQSKDLFSSSLPFSALD